MTGHRSRRWRTTRAAIAEPSAVSDPRTLSGGLVTTFDEPVHQVTTSNLVLRTSGASSDLGTSVTCADDRGREVSCTTGNVVKAVTQPTEPLIPGETYDVIANPAGVSPPIVDRAGNAGARQARNRSDSSSLPAGECGSCGGGGPFWRREPARGPGRARASSSTRLPSTWPARRGRREPTPAAPPPALRDDRAAAPSDPPARPRRPPFGCGQKGSGRASPRQSQADLGQAGSRMGPAQHGSGSMAPHARSTPSSAAAG